MSFFNDISDSELKNARQRFPSSGPRRRIIDSKEQEPIKDIPKVPKPVKEKKNKEKKEKEKKGNVENDSNVYRNRAKERRKNELDEPINEIKGLDLDLYYQRKKEIEESSKQLYTPLLKQSNVKKDSHKEMITDHQDKGDVKMEVEENKTLYFKTDVGRNVFNFLFAEKEKKVVEEFIPGHMVYLFNVGPNDDTQPVIMETKEFTSPNHVFAPKPEVEMIQIISAVLKDNENGARSKKRKNIDVDNESERMKQPKMEEAVDDVDIFGDDDDDDE